MSDNQIPSQGGSTDVDVNVNEALGVIILGLLFFLVLLSLLRSLRRERKLLEKIIEMRAKPSNSSVVMETNPHMSDW
jgi:hypothetical protein